MLKETAALSASSVAESSASSVAESSSEKRTSRVKIGITSNSAVNSQPQQQSKSSEDNQGIFADKIFKYRQEILKCYSQKRGAFL